PPPLFVDYGGPCLINLPEKEKIKVSNGLISTFDQLARNCGASISNISSMATDQSLHSLLADLGFKVAERDYTLIVSLKEDLNYAWNYLIAGNARKAIRKAIKSGVVVDRQESSSALPDFYELYVDSMKRLGVLPCPYSIAKDMWRLMGSSNCMKVFFAKIKNECIAGVLFFTFRNSIIGYLSVSSKKYLKLQPNNLLYYEIIKYGYENNFPFIDYGAAQPNTGSFEFKKSMGGRPREIYSFKKVYSGSKLHLKYILQFPRTLITTAFNKYIFPTAFSKRLDEDTWRLFS
ncbi:MAG TPA: GNAT family N-acetyltransferase, partial [archaeon]|nr:GNAT family N-acetyltransferase [archaeon]